MNQIYLFVTLTYWRALCIVFFIISILSADIKHDTDVIVRQIVELEETVKAMRATLFLVCRGRLLEKQIGNVKIYTSN